MWDPDSARARVVETANLVVEAVRREFPHDSPIIRRPDRSDLERLEVIVPRKVAWTLRPVAGAMLEPLTVQGFAASLSREPSRSRRVLTAGRSTVTCQLDVCMARQTREGRTVE
jgi:hypothetical protein